MYTTRFQMNIHKRFQIKMMLYCMSCFLAQSPWQAPESRMWLAETSGPGERPRHPTGMIERTLRKPIKRVNELTMLNLVWFIMYISCTCLLYLIQFPNSQHEKVALVLWFLPFCGLSRWTLWCRLVQGSWDLLDSLPGITSACALCLKVTDL